MNNAELLKALDNENNKNIINLSSEKVEKDKDQITAEANGLAIDNLRWYFAHKRIAEEEKVEVVEKPVEKKVEVVETPVQKKVEVVEETVEEDSAEEDEFTIDNGLLTQTLKQRREKIIQRDLTIIKEIYD